MSVCADLVCCSLQNLPVKYLWFLIVILMSGSFINQIRIGENRLLGYLCYLHANPLFHWWKIHYLIKCFLKISRLGVRWILPLTILVEATKVPEPMDIL
jgi:hypothetical protein